MTLTAKEIERLRTLAQKYAAIAALPEQKERREGWMRFNMRR